MTMAKGWQLVNLRVVKGEVVLAESSILFLWVNCIGYEIQWKTVGRNTQQFYFIRLASCDQH